MVSPRARRILRQGAAAGLLSALLALLLGVTVGTRLERADLVINIGAEVTSLDPAIVTGIPEGRVARALFEGLCVKDPRTLAPIPGVAESWTVSADGRHYEFRLREDARWSNGDPVTAHDFEWSWERFLHPATAAQYAYQLWYVRGARQYTELPDGRLYAPNLLHQAWVEPLGGDRVRIGLTGYPWSELDPEAAVSAALAAGAPFAPGDAFVGIPGSHWHVPVAGTVRAVNPALATAGELARDPYRAGWVLEAELAPGELARARAAGDLVDAATFRSEQVWPNEVGIRALDERTLAVELVAPTPYFLDLVAFYPLFPVNRRNLEEARERWPETWQIEWLRPETLVTNGPFRIAERRVNDRIRLVKNPHYWDADNVAMETIDVLAVEHYGTMLNLYLTGEVDWIDRVSTNLIPRLMGREDFTPEPYLGTYFYRVNTTRAPFDDPRVRRALALTIDRRAICAKIVKAGQIPNWGLVPHGIEGYELAEMDHADPGPELGVYDAAFARDVARARELLAEAGYPGGRGMRTIEIHYNTSEAHRDIAEVIADGWRRELGIDAKLMNQEWKVYLDTQSNLGYDVSRSAWIGDYPDPNTFLDLFVTGGENNKTGWGHPRYDERIRAAANEIDPVRRMRLLHEAEAVLAEELPILPIYTYVTQNVVKPRLGGFHENITDEHFPKFFYWMDDAELAAKRSEEPAHLRRVDPGGPPDGLYAPSRVRARSPEAR